jgi:hypothetical protein
MTLAIQHSILPSNNVPIPTIDISIPDSCPDCFFPSDNELDIPLLDIKKQGNYIDIPICVYGSQSRGKTAGTILFYIDDRKLEPLWKKPDKILETNAISISELNYSIYKDFPKALALYQIYKKRWMSKYCQTRGIRIFVDMNVHPDYYELNFLGVPKGWSAYATRANHQQLDDLEVEIELVKNHSYPNTPLFLVYGGGEPTRKFCKKYAKDGIFWVKDYINTKFDLKKIRGEKQTNGK